MLFRPTRAFLAAALASLVVACDNDASEQSSTEEAQPGSPSALTPLDQSTAAQDIRITSEIRRRILADAALSNAADNAKIITIAGTVTLRGSVRSQAEKDTLEEIASTVAGVTLVDNQLEVRP